MNTLLNAWATWRIAQIPGEAAALCTYRERATGTRCDTAYWCDASGRHDHRTQYGHTPDTPPRLRLPHGNDCPKTDDCTCEDR